MLGLSGSIEEDFLKEILQFYTFYPNITSPLGGGSWNLQFLVSLPYRCHIPNLVKIGPVVLEKKMLTHDGRRTTDDDGRQPIAIGHLSDSGHLKSQFSAKRGINHPWVQKIQVSSNQGGTFAQQQIWLSHLIGDNHYKRKPRVTAGVTR